MSLETLNTYIEHGLLDHCSVVHTACWHLAWQIVLLLGCLMAV